MTGAVDALNLEQLSSYLENHVEGFQGPINAEKFSGGQSNPTFKISTTSGVYVLRRQPPGKLLKSAHAVDREFRVQRALQNTDVPVAEVYHLCEDRDVIGSMFYLMQYQSGPIYWDPALPKLDNITRKHIYSEMNRVLAALHSVNIDTAGLSDYGKPGNYFQRQLKRWTEQYRAAEMHTIDEMEKLIKWLQQHLPDDDGRVALVHGDYRLDNLVFSPDNSRIIAVLDWELSTLGHPFADLAYQCMQLRLPAIEGSIPGLANVDRESLGIPSEEQYVAEYCQRMNIDGISNWTFYLAFSFFRLAAIIQGVAKRAADGNASNKKAAALGTMVQPLASLALDTID